MSEKEGKDNGSGEGKNEEKKKDLSSLSGSKGEVGAASANAANNLKNITQKIQQQKKGKRNNKKKNNSNNNVNNQKISEDKDNKETIVEEEKKENDSDDKKDNSEQEKVTENLEGETKVELKEEKEENKEEAQKVVEQEVKSEEKEISVKDEVKNEKEEVQSEKVEIKQEIVDEKVKEEEKAKEEPKKEDEKISEEKGEEKEIETEKNEEENNNENKVNKEEAKGEGLAFFLQNKKEKEQSNKEEEEKQKVEEIVKELQEEILPEDIDEVIEMKAPEEEQAQENSEENSEINDPEIEAELEAKVEQIHEQKDKLISYILLAEFDIDKGSTLALQYPKNLNAPKDYQGQIDYFDYLADIMLPDGTQNQEWDQTLFLLNRPPPNEQKSVLWDLPMDDDEPAIEQLEIEVSGSKLVASISQPNLTSAISPETEEGTLFGLNLIHCKKDSSVRRGATIKAISILSKYGELIGSNVIGSGLIPILRKAILEFFGPNGGKRTAKKVFRDVYLAVNQSVDLNRYLNAVDLLPNLKFSIAPQFQSFNCEVLGEVFPIVISYTSSKDVLALGSLYSLLRFIGLENTMELYHAVLLEKKILFLGHNFPVGQLCKFVLSTSILAGPALVNIVVNRIFPYINLTDLSFESVAGFIAGTTNPVLLDTCQFDVLVNLNERTVTWKGSSPIAHHHQQLQQQHQQQQQRPSNNPLKFFKPVFNEAQKLIVKEHPDNEFMRKIEQGFNLRLSERWLQHQFSEYTIRYIDVALGVSDLPKSEIDLFSSRSILIASTNWFNQYYSEAEIKKANGFDVASGVRQLLFAKKNLQYTRTQKCEAIAKVLSAFNAKIISNSDVLLLISYMLKYNGEATLQEEIDLVEEFYLRYSNLSLSARKINLRMQNLLTSKISPFNSN